ncbi:30S ribosomal protein S20 [Candidatus Karelsulcia muelleri]|uniref:Small ribosomal subunit protein bS20 n=1 Tax=Candidatus Karelsulcia muelleri TaxID=336810 RepID=A0A3A1MN92_9FLAO|nr:30S ribosomal protein S20 [Candidatus Karelsulcia muelleri]RIU86048.1 30S ribosomal protein S20 [Candidatus Karelsulcia muelleri]
MANTKSALKQIRKNNLKRLQNKLFLKSTKTAIKKLKLESKKKQVLNAFPKISSLIDKLAKKKIIHKNKSNRIKRKLVNKF